MKYAVLIKHVFRDFSDIRIELVEVPSDIENIGPYEIKKFIEQRLLGNFEVIAVTDRINQTEWDREWK